MKVRDRGSAYARGSHAACLGRNADSVHMRIGAGEDVRCSIPYDPTFADAQSQVLRGGRYEARPWLSACTLVIVIVSACVNRVERWDALEQLCVH